jgi:hypothetical protein
MKRAIAVVFLAGMLYAPNAADSCGPVYDKLIFLSKSAPDAPLSEFYRGNIGVVQSTWQRRYLAIAYRYLADVPLAKAEVQPLEYLPVANDPVAEWLKIRNGYAAKTAVRIEDPYRGGWFEYWTVCLAPAFENAIATLRERTREYSRAELQEWIRGQDAVFANCGKEKVPPPQMPANASKRLRADREYQIAAAEFYGNAFDEAAAHFDRIAQDAESPWRGIAPYLAARSILRKATLIVPEQEYGQPMTFDPRGMELAEKRFGAIVADPTQRTIHRDARRMLDYISFRLRPQERRRELARNLARSGLGRDFNQSLTDYCLLLDQFLDIQPEFPNVDYWGKEYAEMKADWYRSRYEQLKDKRADELTDWIITMQWRTPEAASHSIRKWKETGKKPWLIAALTYARSGSTELPELLAKANEIRATDRAYATAQYQRVRILREIGRIEEARSALADVLPQAKTFPPSGQNLFAKERMWLVRDIDDLILALPRVPVDLAGEDGDIAAPLCRGFRCAEAYIAKQKGTGKLQALEQFDEDAALLVNARLPVSKLVHIVNSGKLPKHLEARLGLATWSRAALLGDEKSVTAVREIVEREYPAATDYVRQVDDAKDDSERKFAAVFAHLHFPAMRPFVDDVFVRGADYRKIDSYRDNWWCAGRNSEWNAGSYSERGMVFSWTGDGAMSLLNDADKASANAENLKLASLGAADEYFLRIALEWGRQHPDDPRVPEALHLGVRAGRYGCSDKGNPLIKQAFQLLHRKYPKSVWAKKTPYWFE